jgi:hypothetical protein
MTATVQRLQDFDTRNTYADGDSLAAEWLHARLAALGLETEFDPFTVVDAPARNVVATQRGTSTPDRIYIICGHYDSTSDEPDFLAPGADDNASGVAAVLEAARVMSSREFQSTVRYVCFGGEEQGLVGSKHYVENVLVPGGVDVQGVINLDMIAFVHPSYPDWDANVFADSTLSLDLGEHVVRTIKDYSTCTEILVGTSVPAWGSDHFWFTQYDYPAVFGIDAQFSSAPDWNPHWHQTTDTIDTLELPYMVEFARGATAGLAELAVLSAAHPVELVYFAVTSTGGTVTVSWRTSLEEANLGFDVLRAGFVEGPSPPIDDYRTVNASMIRATGHAGSRYAYEDRAVDVGAAYVYRLKSIDRSGETQLHAPTLVTVRAAAAAPAQTQPLLHAPHPNPLRSATRIEFELAGDSHVSLDIYDASGRLVRQLLDDVVGAGTHGIEWDRRDAQDYAVGSGVYLVRLDVGGQVLTRKLVVTD